MKEEKIVPAGEVVVNADESPIDQEVLVNGYKEEKIKNPAKKEKGVSKIKGLVFKNVAVIYKDELDKVCRTRIDITVPLVEKDWYQPATRKALSLWFDEQNIIPLHILQVSLPSSGGEEVEIEAPFLDKPIGEFDKKDCVFAAIYHRCRTVRSAMGFDAHEIQQSLFLHLHNLDKLEEDRDSWEEVAFDPTYMVPATK